MFKKSNEIVLIIQLFNGPKSPSIFTFISALTVLVYITGKAGDWGNSDCTYNFD